MIKLELHVFPWNEAAIQLYEPVRLRARGSAPRSLSTGRRVRRRDPDGVQHSERVELARVAPRPRPKPDTAVTNTPFVTYKPGDGLRKTRRSARGAGDSRRRRRTQRHCRSLGRREQSRRRIGQGRSPRRVRLLRRAAPPREVAGARFVGPYGLGGPGIAIETRAAPAPAPKQGVDYSGTNVQEEGVDEPDLVKTNGNTLFAVANGKLNAVDVRDPSRACSTRCRSTAGSSHELLLHGNRLLVLSRGGYWVEPLPGIAARIAPYQPAQSVLAEVDVSEPRQAAPRPHADARQRLRRRAARRRRARGSSRGADPRPAAVRAAEGPTRRRSRRRTKRNRGILARPGLRAGSRPTGSRGRREAGRRSARSSSAAMCAGRRRSRASACSRC